jgi:uncharacterized protein YceH (UPF0502 family)
MDLQTRAARVAAADPLAELERMLELAAAEHGPQSRSARMLREALGREVRAAGRVTAADAAGRCAPTARPAASGCEPAGA